MLSRYLDMRFRGTGTTDFTYDLRRQLVREVSTRHLPGQSTGYDRAYAYDNAGNPTSWRGATRTFNADNQETTGGNWTYDGNGNPTSNGGTTCTYDVGNHLTAFGSEFTAGYRGDGLRAWQQSGTSRKYYLYDGWRPVCELDDEGTVTRTWTFGANGLVAYGQALDLYDWQGNAVNAWTESGTPVTGVVMDAWGVADGAYKFQHGYLNSGEELILCTYRHLDPSRGRWVTRDPIGYSGGIGLYGYVGSRPPTRSDSVGLHVSTATAARDWTDTDAARWGSCVGKCVEASDPMPAILKKPSWLTWPALPALRKKPWPKWLQFMLGINEPGTAWGSWGISLARWFENETLVKLATVGTKCHVGYGLYMLDVELACMLGCVAAIFAGDPDINVNHPDWIR